MSRARIRSLVAAALVLTSFFALAGPLHAQANMVTGNLVLSEGITLSPDAVAVVTLTDRSPDGLGTIVGQQRIDGATGTDAFAVPFDPASINQKDAYSIYASVIDGDTQYQSEEPVAVITGGPTEGLSVPVAVPQYQTAAQITGTIALPSGTEVSGTAVAYAAILDATSGRLVSRQVIPSPTAWPVPFTVGYDAALVNPDHLYVAAAGVIDGSTFYQTKSTTPIAPDAKFDLTVAKTSTVIPTPPASGQPSQSAQPSASAVPSASTAPSTVPSEQPSTPPPTKTPKPSATPTEAPTATPTQAPTASPSPSPSPAPTASPTAPATESPAPSTVPTQSAVPSASTSPTESPSAAPLTVSGTVSYKEAWKLTEAAVLTISVVQVDPNGPTVVTVGKKEIANPGQQPIDFSLDLDPALLVPTSDTFLFATLVDGKEAWTTSEGVKVATNGAPTDNVDVPLTFRPDLIEGDVTGAFLDLPPDLSGQAWASVALLNKTDGTILGFQSEPLFAGSGAFPFEVPFLIANVDVDKDYVAIGNVFDGDRQFLSQAEPVITKGNPYQNVILHGVQVGGATPAPSVAPTATPAPATATPAPVATPTHAPVATATPASSSGSGGGIDPAVILGVLALVVVGAGAVILLMRR